MESEMQKWNDDRRKKALVYRSRVLQEHQNMLEAEVAEKALQRELNVQRKKQKNLRRSEYTFQLNGLRFMNFVILMATVSYTTVITPYRTRP